MKHRGFETDTKKMHPKRSPTTLQKASSPDTELQNVALICTDVDVDPLSIPQGLLGFAGHSEWQ